MYSFSFMLLNPFFNRPTLYNLNQKPKPSLMSDSSDVPAGCATRDVQPMTDVNVPLV